MSQDAAISDSTPPAVTPVGKSFVAHAKLIGIVTFLSRLVGLAREMIAFRYFGDTGVWAAWKVAFTVPNLFRKLLGEGALSAAFIPLYAQAIKRHEQQPVARTPAPEASNTLDYAPAGTDFDHPNDFAVAAVNLLSGVLIALTILGEVLLLVLLLFFDWSPNNLLVLRFSVIMLPYVTLVCLTAFLGGILQVHHRFTAFAFTAVALNICLIVIIVAVARSFDLTDRVQQISAAYWLSGGVLLAGVMQMVMLFPSLKRAGFQFRIMLHCWNPAVKKLMLLTLPLAGGAGVLQIGVMLDKGIGQFLASQPGHETFEFLGRIVRFPIAEGAAARLDLAQFMYQFPLGVFAIALATAIFPTLGREATNPQGDGFKKALRQGIEGALFIGLPASAGMILVAYPAIHCIFEGGRFSAASADWVARSTAIYSGAIWAFSMLQIINRGFYSLHDAATPLRWTIYNLLINLIIEIPLLWTGLGESGMAVGTLVSFSIQSIAMLYILNKRLGGLGISQSLPVIGKMVAATFVMLIACLVVQRLPFYPHEPTRISWAAQLILMMSLGAGVYFIVCILLGIDAMKHLRRKRA